MCPIRLFGADKAWLPAGTLAEKAAWNGVRLNRRKHNPVMNWYYAVGAERKGPVEQAEFDRLIQQGVITSQTLIWREGMADWKPFAEVNPPTAAPPPVDGVVCAGCRGIFSRGEVISLAGSSYCAACKPAAVQRMKEGLVPGASQAEAIRNEHLKHEASVQSVGILYYLGGIFLTLMGVAGMFGAFASGTSGGTIGFVVGLFFLVLAVCQFIVGRGLRKLRPWARTPTAILSGFGLLGFPVGTLINAYILYLVLSAKGRMVLSEEYNQVVAQTPHIKYKTSIVVWIFLALLVGVFVLGIIGLATAKR